MVAEQQRMTRHRLAARYAQPDAARSAMEMAGTVMLFGCLWFFMVKSLAVSYALTLALAVPAAGLYIRLFFLFHDLSHNALFRSRRLNQLLGVCAGVLLLTPFVRWRRIHALHHATVGRLERRELTDGHMWTMTRREYEAAPVWKRLGYRLFRNPVILFGMLPSIRFVLVERFAWDGHPRGRRSVYLTNAALVLLAALAHYTVGLWTLVAVHGPIVFLAGGIGTWFLYIQHTFEGTYWEHGDKWQYQTAAVHGSSHLQMPRLLEWFFVNAGYHHVHHLLPQIPSYRLKQVHEETDWFRDVKPVTLRGSIKALRLHLWDEAQRKMVGWNGQ